jgi:hypothetical protein
MNRFQRRKISFIAILLSLAPLCGAAAAKDEIAVIVSRDTADLHLDVATLRDIYLKKIFLSDRNLEFIPLNLPPDHALRRAFSVTLFNKGAQELQNYWNQRYFHGITPPFVLGSPQAVVEFVAKTPGAIGYVTPCDLDPRVKTALTLPAPPAERDELRKLCPEIADGTAPRQ